MLRFFNLTALIIIGGCLTITNVTGAHLLAASRDPCGVGGLEVTIRGQRYPCGEEVQLGVFSDGKPPAVQLQVPAGGGEADDEADEGAYYTLVMVDPDAPSAKADNTYWLHWLVINIQEIDSIQGMQNGKEIMDYAAPSPPSKDGLHRYQFFILKQRQGELELYKDIIGRGNFDLETFQCDNDFEDPLAAYQIKTKKP